MDISTGSFLTIFEKNSWEEGFKKAFEKGFKKGLIQARREAILTVLEVKFQKPNNEIEKLIQKINSLEVLGHLLEEAKICKSLQSFSTSLNKEINKN